MFNLLNLVSLLAVKSFNMPSGGEAKERSEKFRVPVNFLTTEIYHIVVHLQHVFIIIVNNCCGALNSLVH